MAFDKLCLSIVLCTGLILCSISILSLFLLPSLISYKINQKIPLHNNSESMARWLKVKSPIGMEFRIFHVINSEEVAKGNEDPILVEKGPYMFDEIREKKLIAFKEKSNIIVYTNFKTYYFNSKKSPYSLDDKVIIPNIPAFTLFNVINKKLANNPFKSTVISWLNNLLILENQQAFVETSVRELLFEGYSISFLKILKQQLSLFGLKMSVKDTFGFFKDKNGTNDGEYMIESGLKNVMNYTKIKKWKNKSQLDFWKKGSTCNIINGTDGSQFHPGVNKKDVLRVFSSELCRSIFFKFEKQVITKEIKNLKFIISDQVFQSPLKSFDSKCFCINKSEPLCDFNGLLDVSPCRQQAPIVISRPHFYKADNRLHAKITGLRPNLLKHESYLNVEPLTGIVMEAALRLQINLVFRPVEEIRNFRKLVDNVIPVLWFQERAIIDDNSAREFKEKVIQKAFLAKSFFITLLVVGIFIIVSSSIFTIWNIHKS